MTVDDVPAAERVSDEGFFELDTRLRRAADPAPQRRSEAHRAVWIERTRHLVRTDPGGCWVAEDETGMVGMATSFRRETLWCLATYAVLPGRQGQGIGKPLLAAALDHGRGLHPRHALGLLGREGRADLPPGRVRPAPADVPDRDGRPVRDPAWWRRCARAAPATST